MKRFVLESGNRGSASFIRFRAKRFGLESLCLMATSQSKRFSISSNIQKEKLSGPRPAVKCFGQGRHKNQSVLASNGAAGTKRFWKLAVGAAFPPRPSERSASRWKTVKEGFLERDWGRRFGLESGKGGALLLGYSARSASLFPATPFTTPLRIPRPLPSRWSPRKNTEAEALPFGKTKKFAGGRPF